MDPMGWLQKGLDELNDLAALPELDAADAWRAAVLTMRLLGSSSGLTPPLTAVKRLQEFIGAAGGPDPQQILDRVADELASNSEPWGTLLDALLDADDTLGVLSVRDGRNATAELARRLAALVSLCPERVLSLGAFADMRLQTIRGDAAIGLLWRAVERAPAHILVESLPADHAMSARPASRTAPSQRSRVRPLFYSLPAELQRAAAASTVGSRSIGLEVSELGPPGWVFEERGRLRLEIRFEGKPPANMTLVVERIADGREVDHVPLRFDTAGSTVYADLGPLVGPDNLINRLIAATALPAHEVRVRLRVTDD